jgi:hypothetical protein
MPYKDPEAKRLYMREYMRRYRTRQTEPEPPQTQPDTHWIHDN